VRQQQELVEKLLTGNDESAIDRSLRSVDTIERQAAVTAACSMGPRFGKELIAALDDSAPDIRQEARAGLVAMAGGSDFGPDEPANDRVRSAAMRKWEEWYESKVRGALPPAAWRSSRTQLKNMLKADDEQSRLAAILVIRYRRFTLVNELLKLFDDPSQAVRREARNALVDLADGTDFGPADFSKTADVDTAISNWRLWDERRKRRFRNGVKTDDQIRVEMGSSDDEVRLAAVSTAAARSLPFAEELVARITDSVSDVRQAARHGLVQLASGTDFGPSEGASPAAVAESGIRWKQWLSTYAPPKPAKSPVPKQPPVSQ
jgi:HEAT repeat protein